MKHFNQTLKTFTFYLTILTTVFFAQNFAANAATRTWDGGGVSNNFSEAANWSSDLALTSADDVIFSATSTKNASVDADLTVNSVSINSGYTRIITQNSVLTVTNTFTQSAGIFQGTAANANFGYLLLNAGSVFNAPTGTLSLTSQVSYYVFTFNGGTFNASGGTINANGRTDLNYFSGAATPVFNNLMITQTMTILNPAITVTIITVYNGTNSGNNGANWVFDPSCFPPTASNVSISGKVLNAVGRGIANVRVILTDTNGISRVAVSNSFGNYKFDEVASGQTVVVSVVSKKFVFANPTQVLNVAENTSEINFTAEER